MAMFHMSNDSGLFRTAQQLSEAGYERAGTDWIHDGAEPERYVPLYEAKMVHQFDHRWATYEGIESRDVSIVEKQDSTINSIPRYWIRQDEVDKAFKTATWKRNWVIGWRDICRSTDERTVIASVIPRFGCNDKFLLLLPNVDAKVAAALVASLNSVVFDYIARQKLGGTSLKYFVMRQLAMIPPEYFGRTELDFIVPRVLELSYTSNSMAAFARDVGCTGPPFNWNEDRRATLRAELDAWFARAYGLTRDELRYILDPAEVMDPDFPSETFRGLKYNETRKYGEYRTRRLVLEAWDRMDAGNLPAPQPYSAPHSTPGSGVNGTNQLFGAGPLFEAVEETR